MKSGWFVLVIILVGSFLPQGRIEAEPAPEAIGMCVPKQTQITLQQAQCIQNCQNIASTATTQQECSNCCVGNITPTAGGTVAVSIAAAVANDAFSQSKSNTAASSLSTSYDGTAPTTDSTSPTDTTTAVDVSTTIAVVFSEAMDTSTLTTNTTDTTCSGSLQVSSDNFSTCVRMAAAPVASNSNKTFTVTPNTTLANFATFKIRVTTSARDSNGTAIAATSTTGTGFTCVGAQTLLTATVGGLSISTDGGASFTNKTTANGLGNNFVSGVFASGSTAYAATNGGLSISTDGGASFTNKTTADGLGSNSVRGVFASGGIIYAATGGGLSISTDGGTSFTNKTTAAGLGDNIVKSVFASGNTIYAGTNGGLSISTNGGTSFTNKTTAAGLGSTGVSGLSVSGSTIYAATQGGLSISTNEGTSFTNKTTTNGLGDNEQLGVFVFDQ